MPYTQLTLGLTLTLPTVGTRNWGATMQTTTWTKISQHAHTGSGDGTQLGAGSITDFALTRDKLAKNIGHFQYASTLGPSGADPSQAINWANGSIQKIDLDAATGTVTVGTPTNPVTGTRYKLFVIQASTVVAISWPASFKWPQGQAPILSETENAVDIIELYYDGTNYFCDWNNGYA